MPYQSFPAYELFGEAFPSEDSGNISLLLDHGCGSARDFHPTSIEVRPDYNTFRLFYTSTLKNFLNENASFSVRFMS